MGTARISLATLFVILLAASALQAQEQQGTGNAIRCDRGTTKGECFKPGELVDRIVYCANNSREYRVTVEGPNGSVDQYCPDPKKEIANTKVSPSDRKKGKAGAEVKLIDVKCGATASKEGDPRLMPDSLLAEVIVHPLYLPGRVGLRITSGIYCEQLKVQDVDVKSSLVLDHSIFLKGIYVRNAAVHGDLSFDSVQVINEIKVLRSTVDGNLYARTSAIDGIEVLDSTITRSIELTGSVFPGTATTRTSAVEIDRVKVGGHFLLDNALVGQVLLLNDDFGATLNLRKSTFLESAQIDQNSVAGAFEAAGAHFSMLLARANTFANAVDFHDTQVRCELNISKNNIKGDFNLVRSGFGAVLSASDNTHQWIWSEPDEKALMVMVAKANLNKDRFSKVKDLKEKSSCIFAGYKASQKIRITDDRVEKNLCVKDFTFESHAASATPGVKEVERSSSISDAKEVEKDDRLESDLILNGTSVGGNAILSIWRHGDKTAYLKSGYKPLYTRFLALRASQAGQCPLATCVELLGFRSGGLVIDLNDSDRPFGMLTTGMQFDRIFSGDINCPYPDTGDVAKGEGQMLLPKVDQVTPWLDMTDSIEPHTAMIGAFERAGVDATELKVKRARFEWESDRIQKCANPTDRQSENFCNAFRWVLDPGLLATALLGVLADYGYRPAYVVIWIAVVLVSFMALFWLGFGIVAFRPENTTVMRPVGPIFLFDRLIPVYQILDDNYQIASFYRWRYSLRDLWRLWRRSKVKRRIAYPARRSLLVVYRKIPVSRASARVERHANRLLVCLKLVGAVLALFLVAAVKAVVEK
jgi:hypothetical protein